MTSLQQSNPSPTLFHRTFQAAGSLFAAAARALVRSFKVVVRRFRPDDDDAAAVTRRSKREERARRKALRRAAARGQRQDRGLRKAA